MKRHTLLIAVVMIATAFVSCSYENTATVTIDTGIRAQAHINWFDRVLAFLSLSQPLQADPPPELDLSEIFINVTASDMQTITQEIPLDTGRITLEVPAGSQRTFEVVAGSGNVSRIYGGIRTVDLSPGQQVNLEIEMGELFNISSHDGSATYDAQHNYILVTVYTQDNPYIIAFKLYRKPINSNFSDVYYVTINNFSFIINHDSLEYTIPITLETNYDYYISAINQYGEGEKSVIYGQ